MITWAAGAVLTHVLGWTADWLLLAGGVALLLLGLIGKPWLLAAGLPMLTWLTPCARYAGLVLALLGLHGLDVDRRVDAALADARAAQTAAIAKALAQHQADADAALADAVAQAEARGRASAPIKERIIHAQDPKAGPLPPPLAAAHAELLRRARAGAGAADPVAGLGASLPAPARP